MLVAATAAVLVLDAFLAAVAWLLIMVVWNTIVREELEVRSNLLWGGLLGTVVLIANAAAIAIMSPIRGISPFLSFVSNLAIDAILVYFAWFLIFLIWNNVAKEKFRVRGNLVWARLLGTVVLIANAAAIAHLLQ